MMEPQDYRGRQQVSHGPTIAISIAAVLSIAVSAMMYKDYVRNRYEKEFAEKEQRLLQHYGHAQGGVPGGQLPMPAVVQQAPVAVADPATAPDPVASADHASLLAQAASQRGVETALPSPRDPQLDQLRGTLEQTRSQGQLLEQRYHEISGGPGSMSEAPLSPVDAGGGTQLSREGIGDLNQLPEFLREAVESPPPSLPGQGSTQLERLKEDVRKAPALAKVTGFDQEWSLLTFNAGATSRVQPKQRFAVRRGDDLLGWVIVDEVGETESTARLINNRNNDASLKPAPGDDLITYELPDLDEL